MICTPRQLLGNQIENEMDRAGSMYGGEEKYMQYSGLKTGRQGATWKT